MTPAQMQHRFRLWVRVLVAALFFVALGQANHIRELRAERDVFRLAAHASLAIAEKYDALLGGQIRLQQYTEARLALLAREDLINKLARYIASVTEARRIRSASVSRSYRTARAIVVSAHRYGLDYVWLTAQMEQESLFDVYAVSHKGAKGLMQLMPRTAELLGVPPARIFHIETNVDAGARYLARHVRDYGDLRRALIRYVGGDAQYAADIQARAARIAGL
jgi:soluble lytic murein transglycosylase-like protein